MNDSVAVVNLSTVLVTLVLVVAIGVTLWALLPRGVVLTLSDKNEPDTWLITNDGPLAIQITSVRVAAPEGVNLLKRANDNPTRSSKDLLGVKLSLIGGETGTHENSERAWNEVVLNPGDSVTAFVPHHASLFVDYRRAGWSGVLETRELAIHGGPSPRLQT